MHINAQNYNFIKVNLCIPQSTSISSVFEASTRTSQELIYTTTDSSLRLTCGGLVARFGMHQVMGLGCYKW